MTGVLYRHKSKVKTNHENPMLESTPPKREIKQVRGRNNLAIYILRGILPRLLNERVNLCQNFYDVNTEKHF